MTFDLISKGVWLNAPYQIIFSSLQSPPNILRVLVFCFLALAGLEIGSEACNLKSNVFQCK